jgi:hypothetical protein
MVVVGVVLGAIFRWLWNITAPEVFCSWRGENENG